MPNEKADVHELNLDLPAGVMAALAAAYPTVEALGEATNAELAAVEGIGPARVEQIRRALAARGGEPAPEKAQRRYFIVNPAGAVHEATREHATWRLKTDLRYRMATPAEIDRYLGAKRQDAGMPIARPWNPDPDVEPEIDL